MNILYLVSMKNILLTVLLVCTAVAAQAHGLDSAQLAKEFIESIKSSKIDSLKKLIAPPEVYRKISPNETEKLTDSEIITHTAGNPRLQADFDSLLSAAKTKKVDRNKLQYDSVKVENVWGDDNAPWAMMIYYSYKGISSTLGISVIRFEGSWYFMEMLTNANAFKEF